GAEVNCPSSLPPRSRCDIVHRNHSLPSYHPSNCRQGRTPGRAATAPLRAGDGFSRARNGFARSRNHSSLARNAFSREGKMVSLKANGFSRAGKSVSPDELKVTQDAVLFRRAILTAGPSMPVRRSARRWAVPGRAPLVAGLVRAPVLLAAGFVLA